jgi:FHA domain
MRMSEFIVTRFKSCATTCAAPVALVTSVASVIVALATISLPDPATAMDFSPMLETTRTFLTTAWAASYQWTTDNYGRTPALIVGLAATLLLPPLALASGLITRLALPRQTARGSNARDTAPLPSMLAHSTAPDHPSNMAWPREAWLTGSTNIEAKLPPLLRTMPRELLSIGRGEDNDLVLDETTVHRYHAIIQRTPDALFLIKDLSGPGGNGVFVNDERVTEAHLLDADRIALGSATLVFHARRVGDK